MQRVSRSGIVREVNIRIRRTDVRQWRKPSETVCPARVAMMEDDWPEASRASANSVAAAAGVG